MLGMLYLTFEHSNTPDKSDTDRKPSRINTFTLLAPAVVPKGLPTGQGWTFVPDEALFPRHEAIAQMPPHNTANQHKLLPYGEKGWESESETSLTATDHSTPRATQSLAQGTAEQRRAWPQPSALASRVRTGTGGHPGSPLNPAAPIYVPPPLREAPSVKHLECYFWRRGSCKFTEDTCLYAHHETGQVAEGPRRREPGSKCLSLLFASWTRGGHHADKDVVPAVAGKNAKSLSPTYLNWREVHGQFGSFQISPGGGQVPRPNFPITSSTSIQPVAADQELPYSRPFRSGLDSMGQ